ncbi:SDR family NAD(P)-dependent oxidoreductase [Acuticoccus sp. I52.16.1]|uniref:SDR family NAD(P)-dependent oxidoreductase n=1 Tax=Acuticoccus sp. I52.16.1 TaxID=2928472 RepID=UPI001FCFAE43|nr:SDR family oxidoreductase [Acuticoccus sp. I52.16.1]UOM36556.1 SDR family oxidoreductase [Acuticoccus sp. I52.16.1]
MRTIITGAASGIGLATARLFAASPAAGVLLVDRDGERLDAAARELGGAGRVSTHVADLADPAAPAGVIAAARAAFGGLDALVSNAGAIHSFALAELSGAEFDRLFAVNARATFLLAQAAYPLLKESRGAIVATVSTAAEHPAVPLGAYSASKAALLMLVRQIASEWGPDGIRCNGVSPGPTHTAMTSASYDDPAKRDQRGRDIPLGRVGRPEDIARAIHFLAGPEAAYISGVNLLVDGGLSANLGRSGNSAANAMTSR